MGGRPMMVGGGLASVIIVLIVLCMGGDPRAILQLLNPQGGGVVVPDGPGPQEGPVADDEQTQFVKAVLAQTEDVWNAEFQKVGKQYQEPTLVLFNGQVDSACGYTSAAVGPFYCPADQKVYLDLGFFREMEERFQAPGDFAQAYVIAHEVGHHVQNLLGISDDVHRQQQRVSKVQANDLSVRLELQADFFAGVWAHHANEQYQILEPGDVKEALEAAEAIGDDRLQMQSRGYVVPDSFTHGSSEQRAKWFYKGLKTGDLNQGDTFSARDL
jgi:predicted metalloprotease